ncbi:MAG: DUF6702 family protein [Owenweeksia sp.]|nr:DUF6702 family protein [Owenweeksia sp.]
MTAFKSNRHETLLIFLAITGLAKHDFHVSITNAEWHAPSQHLQISMKLFTDDLEAALIEDFTTVPNLGKPMSTPGRQPHPGIPERSFLA